VRKSGNRFSAKTMRTTYAWSGERDSEIALAAPGMTRRRARAKREAP
jgi:hypothetical protein